MNPIIKSATSYRFIWKYDYWIFTKDNKDELPHLSWILIINLTKQLAKSLKYSQDYDH